METLYTLQQRNIAQSQTLQAGSGRPVTPLDAARANDIFDHFLNASTLKSILGHYRLICDLLHLRPSTLPNFYPKLKQHLTSWRAKAVWKKFDARANNKVYGKGRVCPETRVLIIGAGPCGLRTAIEAQMLGAKVVVLEKRDRMSRNNVLHLWPFVIDDLRSLGAKKFFGKFCAGSIDHISIRQLQCILLKVALLLGIEIHTEVSYESLVEPSIENKRGWRAQVKPTDHPVSQYEFDVIIGADGKRNTLQGFKRKEFRGKLAIAITANFINRRTEAEARVEEISGVAFIFNQKFFKDLYAETQIDLENIVYYKDDTHYFVMTAKKHSLLSKSVIRSDQTDTARLLSPDNVDRTALMAYAREAAEFSTGRQMLDLEFAVNHYGQPDVAMFDFTSMYAAENASRIVDREGYRLLCILVGDSLLEPFWPTGSGCARGFLSSLDAAWAIRAWGSAVPPLSVLAERESIYRLLGGTTPENLHRDSKSYSLDPSSRYPKLNRQVLSSHQVIGLYDTDDVAALKAQTQKEEEVVEVQHQHGSGVIKETAKKRRKIDEEDLLSWIKKQVVDYNLPVPNLSENTFNDGKILCAILHHYRPDLVDYKDLPEDNALCCHIAIELLEKEIGISSIIAPSEMATMECTRQQLISYLSQIYETFKREIAHINHPKMKLKLPSKTCSGNQSYATTNSNHSNTSAKHKLFASNKNMLSTTPLPKLYHSPTRNDEDNVQKLYRTNNQPASPLNKSSPNVLTNNKLSSVFDNKQELQLNKIKLPQQQPQENNKVDDHRIKVLDVDEELDEESNNSMEELTARLMDRFRGVVSSGAGVGGGLNATLGDGGGGGKVRVIQTISNPFSAITEKDDDDDDDDDEVTTDMPELKQHTLNALTGATNTTIVPTESPMHHRNFAGLRATPPHHHQLTQTKPNHHHYNHHHIRQAIPLAVTGNNVSASGGGVGAASTVAGSSVATGRSRKRKSAAPAGGGGAGRGDADGVGLHVAQYERQQEITSNRLDRQQRRKHHRRHQTEQFLKSMQMLQANCKPDHSEPFEDYSLFVYRQTAPNFEDRVRDLEKKFIYIPDHPPAQWQQKNERDEDIAARMRQIEDRWYETTAQEANAVAQRNMSGAPKKPKDLMRAIGKIETSDWNIREIEKKIKENRSGGGGGKGGKERVPKWSREQFQARQAKMERKHLLDRQDSTNGKYSELDKNLKLLDQRLKEGTIRDLNQHKIAKIAEKLKPKEQVDNQKEKSPKDIKPSPSVVLPSANSSEYCHFCAKRVYLMEKLNAENRCFHRNCFRCEYCHTLLRPGAYKYDTDGKYGHRFYCIHHYGFSGQLPALVSARNRGAPSTRAQKDTGLVTPTNQPGIICDSLLTSTPNNKKSVEGTLADIAPTREVVEGGAPLGILGRVTGVDLLDRVQTPERIEFSNLSTGNASSDHEEPPSIMDEDEWTDRNFGASTAEVCSSDDDDSYSDSDSEEEYEEAVEEPATKEGNLRILERYSRFSRKHDSDSAEYSSSEQSSYCENTSGDEESDTATEGEEEIRARELRKQEVRLEPPIITDTGTDTEINSDDTVYSKSNEAPNSATEISTDSEFAQDEPTPTREIPAIIFNDAFVTKTRGSGHVARVHVTSGDLRKHNNAPPPPPPQKPTAQQNHNSHTPTPKKPTNLPLLNRLTDGFPLNRTQSTSGIAAMRSLELKKRYLLGESNCSVATNAAIQKSGSASTLDSKLKSFHSNITDCQRMLKPAQEGAVRSVFSGDNVAAIGGAAVDFKANETAVLVLAKNGEHQTPPLSFTITTQNTSNQPCPSLETTQSKPVKNVPATEQSYQNELEGRPRSPAHETSIIVPTIDWPRRNKPEKGFSDRTSSESDAEVAAERSANITETVEDKQIDIEPLDSLNYMPLVTDAAPKSICSEKKALNQPKTLPGLFGRPETASGRSTPTQGGGNDSCITGCLTETELSDWARDGAVSDDFDYEYEHALTSRKNNEPKKLGNFNSTIESNNKLGFDDKLTSLNALDGKSMHVCGRSDDIVECVNSILNPNLKNIDYMDTGSENSSCSDDDVKKNNGYVQFYNENDMADDSLSPVINNLSKLTVLEVKNPLMTATIEDFDELSTPTKNTGFCEVVGATPMPSSNCNFGGTVVDLKPTDLEQLKRKQTLVQNEMDSLQVAADTGTEDNTCSDSTVKNVDDFKPTYDNNNVSVDKKRLEDKLMQVKQDMFTKKSIKDDCELYAAHCQRLQSKLEFTNVRDSIDVRKNAQKNQPILAPSPKPDLIQQDEPQVQFRLTLTPTNLYQKEIIAKERDLNQRLIHEMILHKYKSENKSLERKKRPRNSSFSPCGANTFELSKSATTADLTANNVTPPDVILSTTNTAALKELQKSQTMAEIKITPSNRNVTSTSDKPMVPVLSQQMVPQQVYTCYQIDRTPSYDKMRQEARAKAKLLSDTALGLSPEDKLLRLRERIRGHDNTADAATSQRTPVHRTNSHVALRDTKSGLVVNRNSIAESHFNSAPVDGAAIYAHDTLNSERRNKSFRRPGVADKAPELTGSRSVQNIQRGGFSGGASFKSDSNLLLDKSLGELGGCGNSGEKKVAKDRERRKSITRVISDFFGSIRKDKNSNLSAARGFLARISPKARERSKSCINLPRENLVKETISLRKSASSDLNFSPHSSARDTSPPPVPPLPDNYGTKLEDSSDAELDFQRQYSLDNIDPALPVDNTSIGHATGSRRNSRGTAKRSARQAQLKRHRTAQEIQRKLEETEVKIRDLELAGVAIEKRLGSGEPETTCSGGVGDAKRYAECGGGRGRPVPNDVLSEWFGVMRELTEWRRYERELVTRAEELQLEDRHARLQNKLRDKLTCDTTEGEGGVRGTSTDAGVILEEMMDIVAKRDCIIANLEQDKQRYTDEDTEFEEQMLAKGMKLIPTFKKSVESN